MTAMSDEFGPCPGVVPIVTHPEPAQKWSMLGRSWFAWWVPGRGLQADARVRWDSTGKGKFWFTWRVREAFEATVAAGSGYGLTRVDAMIDAENEITSAAIAVTLVEP